MKKMFFLYIMRLCFEGDLVKRDLMFLFLLIPISLFFYSCCFFGQKEYSDVEYRTLAQIPSLKYDDFINKKFQENFESAVADQVMFSKNIKAIYINFFNNTNAYINNYLMLLTNQKDDYTRISENFYLYEDGDYILDKKSIVNDYIQFEEVKDYYKNILSEVKIDQYLYYVTTDAVVNFVQGDIMFYDWLVEAYRPTKSDYLKIKNYDDYKKYYYPTDHHWNHLGSYEGYKDIMKILLGDEENILEPVRELIFDDIKFSGSRARTLATTKYSQKFGVYEFDIPEHEVYINGELKNNYREYEKYISGKYSTGIWDSHYELFYGRTYRELIFDFNQSEKENVLIISNSFGSAVQDLIASHFNKTYVIDKSNFESGRNISEYIEERNITKLILIGHINFFNKRFS